MGFGDAVRICLNKYATIQGRARRSEYWWFYLFNIILAIVAGIIDSIIGIPIFAVIVTLGLIIPGICVSIRRMHDKDKSGWWLLIVFVPIVGVLVLLYWFVTRGTIGDNRFGPDPVV